MANMVARLLAPPGSYTHSDTVAERAPVSWLPMLTLNQYAGGAELEADDSIQEGENSVPTPALLDPITHAGKFNVSKIADFSKVRPYVWLSIAILIVVDGMLSRIASHRTTPE